ncbi:hypothetical protein BASA81_017583 [Batrachochytrium salamandrivorans]|nr:hypothetical protein BASA81_017583 [Batrachochytrium salamandrivorans]
MIVAPLDATQSVYSPSLKRHIFLTDWPLLVADFLDAKMVAGYPRTTSGHMSQGIGTFHNGRQHILPRTGKRNIQDPILSKWDRKSVYARFHRGLGHLKFDR